MRTSILTTAGNAALYRALLFLAWLFGASVIFETYPAEEEPCE